MSRWLDAYFTKSSDAAPAEKNHISPTGEPSKPSKPIEGRVFGGFEGFESSHEPRFAKISGAAMMPPNRAAEAAERAASIPRGYTRAELEAARLDAQRLGYSGRTTIH